MTNKYTGKYRDIANSSVYYEYAESKGYHLFEHNTYLNVVLHQSGGGSYEPGTWVAIKEMHA